MLVVNSYHEGYPWTDDIVRGIRTTLAGSSLPIDLDLEYLDWRRHPEPAAGESFANYLRDKFKRRPDVIIATDDEAVRLLLRHHADLFPDVPVVFCGVNEYRGSGDYVAAHPEEHPWMAGVLETIDLDDTIDTALRLHPDTREIISISQYDDTTLKDSLATRHPGLILRAIKVQQLDRGETIRQLSSLKRGDLVLLGVFSHDGAGRFLSLAEGVRLVVDHTNAPIYTVSKPSLGLGVVGGKINDGFSQGQTAAGMAISVLKGVSPKALGILRCGASRYEFDYRGLRRWHIPESALPADSIVINRPDSLYRAHPRLVWTVCGSLGLQFLVILGLLVQRRRRMAAEAALLAHSQQLAQSNYMLEQFAYITAHDFQEPIRTVAIFTELLHRKLDEKLDDQSRQSIRFVLDHSRRLHSMVRGLLDWVRSVDAPPDSPPHCDSAQIMRQVVERHRDAIENGRAVIAFGHLPPVPLHAHHMRELLNHLIWNAIQHGGPSPVQVFVSAQREAHNWKFLVHNSGVKIPPQLQTRIFGVFRRLDGAREGLGMGLAICRRIVDFYGGRIWVDSAETEGCTFCFTIPDRARPRLRRPQWLRLQAMSYRASHAHSDR